MMRMQADLVTLCDAAIDGRLDQVDFNLNPRVAVGVVTAAAGYPGDNAMGDVISGLSQAEPEGVKTIHAVTQASNGQLLTQGGRVLCVTALGDTVTAAQQRAYQRVAGIQWNGAYYRKDIAYRAIAREQQ